MGITTLQSAMKQAVKQLGLEEKVLGARIEKIWDELYGERMAKIHKFEKGVLLLKTSSSTWRFELELRKDLICRELNENLGKNVIRKIVIN